MQELLNTIYKAGEYACFYTDDSSKFCFGQLEYLNDNWFALRMISPDGDHDGILVKHIDDIRRIERNTKYVAKMRRLMSANPLNSKDTFAAEEPIIPQVLAYTKTRRKIISVELNNSGFDDAVGLVKAWSDSICIINQIDEYGKKDGNISFYLEDITQICFDSGDERRLEKLII